jgi:phospholipid/cholesterol/gamma-HCH transport system substrate-binding protein
MREKRVAGKVGLFVALAAVASLGLVIIFIKGYVFTPTYELRLKAESVGGLRRGAAVLLSGVVIGTVVSADVAPGGRDVLIRLKIKDKYRVHADARFMIQQIGFLGDQYVEIHPQENKAPLLPDGAIVPVEPAFDFQEVGRSGRDLITEFNKSAKLLNQALERITQTLLNEQTLTNVEAMVTNFRVVSDKAVTAMDAINTVVQSNAGPISIAVSNLVLFSTNLDTLASELRETVATNRYELTVAVKNLQTTAKVLEGIGRDIESGKGLAGALIKDAGLQSNMTNLVANLTILSSNLTKYGLLYKPKKPKAGEEAPRVYPGRSPVSQ